MSKLLTSRTCFGFTTGGHTGEEVFLAAYHPDRTSLPLGMHTNIELNHYLCALFGMTHDTLEELTAGNFAPHTEVFKDFKCEIVPAKALSGGNQQKAIIAREVSRDPDLLIVANPTRGLDVGAIEFIHKRLIDQRDKMKAVLLISFELDEILNVSDRIAVIHGGKIVGIVDPKETNEQELGLLMAGYSLEEARKELANSGVGEANA